MSAPLLTAACRVRSDTDFVSYGQPQHPAGAVRHTRARPGATATDTVTVALPALEDDVDRVVIAASADDGPFRQASGLRLRVSAGGSDVAVNRPGFIRRPPARGDQA